MSSEKKNILIVHNYYQIPGGEDTVVANEKTMLAPLEDSIITKFLRPMVKGRIACSENH